MSDCCTSNTACSSSTGTTKLTCPHNQKPYKSIALKTVLHHLKQPWQLSEAQLKATYAFCDDPECPVIYVNNLGETFQQHDLRTPVSQKSNAPDALICYCFQVDRQTAKTHPEAQAFVVQQTKAHHCACDIQNPSGKCCLKDFNPNPQIEIGKSPPP